MNAGASAGAAAAHNHMVQALRASGVIVELEPEEFQKLVSFTEDALVVVARGGFLSSAYKYLVSYKGLAFYTKSATPLHLPGEAKTVAAKKIWVPT